MVRRLCWSSDQMVQTPSSPTRASRADHQITKGASSSRTTRRSTTHDDDDDDLNGCSGQSCSSCTASCVADCVAVCCCPCAIVNLLVLVFVKVPCLMGKRCVRVLVTNKGRRRSITRGKKKKKKRLKKNKEINGVVAENGEDLGVEEKKEVRNEGVEEEEEEKREKFCARFEAERVWWELYQVGHWGFGRVSFSGSTQGKGN